MRGRFFSGNAGFFTAWILMSVMAVASFPFRDTIPENGNGFSCAVDPSLLLPEVSYLLEWGLLTLIAAGMVLINRKNNFIPTLTTVHASVFMLLCAADPVLTGGISSGLILAAMNLISLQLIYRAFKSGGKSGREYVPALFCVGLIFSCGSLFQYVSVWFIPLYIFAAATLKLVDFRSLAAMFAGIAVPYWIIAGVCGFRIPGFRLPEISLVFADRLSLELVKEEMYVLTVAVVSLILSFRNYFSEALNNMQMRAMQRAMIIPGIGSYLVVFATGGGMDAISATVFMFTAYQVGYLSGVSNQRGAGFALAFTAVFCITSLIFILNG